MSNAESPKLPKRPMLYDPPSGWQYGFPKVYRPNPDESIEDTLVRDGYPRKMAEELGKYTRFIG